MEPTADQAALANPLLVLEDALLTDNRHRDVIARWYVEDCQIRLHRVWVVDGSDVHWVAAIPLALKTALIEQAQAILDEEADHAADARSDARG